VLLIDFCISSLPNASVESPKALFITNIEAVTAATPLAIKAQPAGPDNPNTPANPIYIALAAITLFQIQLANFNPINTLKAVITLSEFSAKNLTASPIFTTALPKP